MSNRLDQAAKQLLQAIAAERAEEEQNYRAKMAELERAEKLAQELSSAPPPQSSPPQETAGGEPELLPQEVSTPPEADPPTPPLEEEPEVEETDVEENEPEVEVVEEVVPAVEPEPGSEPEPKLSPTHNQTSKDEKVLEAIREAKEKATRKYIAEATELEPSEVKGTLLRLKSSGKILQLGERRWTYYVLAGANAKPESKAEPESKPFEPSNPHGTEGKIFETLKGRKLSPSEISVQMGLPMPRLRAYLARLTREGKLQVFEGIYSIVGEGSAPPKPDPSSNGKAQGKTELEQEIITELKRQNQQTAGGLGIKLHKTERDLTPALAGLTVRGVIDRKKVAGTAQPVFELL